MGFSDFSVGLFKGVVGAMKTGTEVAQQAARYNAESAGSLAPYRDRAESLSRPSHPQAGRILAESSPADRSTLFSTRGSAGPFREGLMVAANRTNITAA